MPKRQRLRESTSTCDSFAIVMIPVSIVTLVIVTTRQNLSDVNSIVANIVIIVSKVLTVDTCHH